MGLEDFLATRPCPTCEGDGEDVYVDGAALRAARKATGVSLRALADQIPCAPQYLSDAELGRRNMSETMARRYLNLLGLL